MKDARRLKIVFGRDGFQMELNDDRHEGDNRGSGLTFGQKVVRSLSWLVTGVAIANAITVFKLV